jgi:integrase
VKFRIAGRELSGRSTGQTNKTRAEAWAREEFDRLVASSSRDALSIGAWAEPFFSSSCPHVARVRLEGGRYADNTARVMRAFVVRYILPDPICELQVAGIRRGDVLAFRDRIVALKGRSRTTQQVLGCLRIILREALYRDLCDADPFAGVKSVSYEAKARGAIDAFQLLKLLCAPWADDLFFLATILAAFTGLRAGEVRALQWQDLAPPSIFIRRSLSGGSAVPTDPKWGKTRVVPYPLALQGILEARRGPVGDWVFSRGDGPIGYSKWAGALRSATRVAGLEEVTLHSLRHSLNTFLRGTGVSDEVLRGSFGWSAPSVQEAYTHRDLYDYSGQAAAIDNLLGGGEIGKG